MDVPIIIVSLTKAWVGWFDPVVDRWPWLGTRLHFLELLSSGRSVEALQYARSSFNNFADSQLAGLHPDAWID